MIKEFFKSLKLVFASLSYMQQHKLMRVYWLVFLIIIAVFALGIYSANPIGNMVANWVDGLITNANMSEWLTVAIKNVSWFISWILTLTFVFLFSGNVVLVILSPIFSLLAEKTMAIETGKVIPFSFSRFAWSIFRGIAISLRNMLMQVVVTVPLLLLALIPMAGLVVPIFIFIVSAYFMGFSMADYTFDVYGFGYRQSLQFVRRRRVMLCGIGCLYAFAIKIPFFGIYAAILIAPMCVVAAGRIAEIQEIKPSLEINSKR